MTQMQKHYTETIAPKLKTELHVKNTMAVPRIEKIVVNMGVKDAITDKKIIEKMAAAMGQITGQKPKLARAKKSIATFKLREGDPIGLMVTLRGKRQYEFLERLINVVLPRLKDFHGIASGSFDGQGNYSLGFREYAVFPEIDESTVDRAQGLQINIVTSADDDKHAYQLLKALGMPFEKGENRFEK